MNLRQIVRRYRDAVFSGQPQVEFINMRSPRLQVDTLVREPAPVTLTYAAAMAVDVSLGNTFRVTPTNAVAFTFNAPTNPPAATVGQEIRITIINTTGGALGAATFTGGAGGFRLAGAWVQPATGNRRTVSFAWDGSVWQEISRNAADVPN